MAEEEAAMNASVNIERNSWRLPPDETVQVADPRSKSAQVKEVNRSTGFQPSGSPSRCSPIVVHQFSRRRPFFEFRLGRGLHA